MPPLMTIRRGLIAASGGAAEGVTFGSAQVAFTGNASKIDIAVFGTNGVLCAYEVAGDTTRVRAGIISGTDVSWGAEVETGWNADGTSTGIEKVFDNGSYPYYAALVFTNATSVDLRAYPVRVDDSTSVTFGTSLAIQNTTSNAIGNIATLNRDYHFGVWGKFDNIMRAYALKLNPGSPDTMTNLGNQQGTSSAGKLPTNAHQVKAYPTERDQYFGLNRRYAQIINWVSANADVSIMAELTLGIDDFDEVGGAHIETDTIALVYPNSTRDQLLGMVVNVNGDYSLSAGAEQTIDTGLSSVATVAVNKVSNNRIFAAYDEDGTHKFMDIARTGNTLTKTTTHVFNTEDPVSTLAWYGQAVQLTGSNTVVCPYRKGSTEVGVIIGTYE